MKLYKTKQGIVVENGSGFYLLENEGWDRFVNDDDLVKKIKERTKDLQPSTDLTPDVLAPIGSSQELWACGVTYCEVRLEGRKRAKMQAAEHSTQKCMKQKDLKCFSKLVRTALLVRMIK